MTDSQNKDFQKDKDRDEISLLISSAGPRDSLPPESMDKAHRRVAAHWETVVAADQSSARRRRFGTILKAAGVALVALLPLLYLQMGDISPEIVPAYVNRIVGDVQIDGASARNGLQVQVDAVIETGTNGRIALEMASGQSLRMDHGSQLIVHSPDHVTLQVGAVYIDTGKSDLPPILVSTPMGTAQDVGTQFQLRITDSILFVAVRDGIVKIDQLGRDSLTINTGRYIELATTGENLSQPLPEDDNSFDWVETILPAFDLEGATLASYLLWYARESGLRLRWADAESEAKARDSTLSGSISGATLEESLQIVRRVSPNFLLRTEDDSLRATVQ